MPNLATVRAFAQQTPPLPDWLEEVDEQPAPRSSTQPQSTAQNTPPLPANLEEVQPPSPAPPGKKWAYQGYGDDPLSEVGPAQWRLIDQQPAQPDTSEDPWNEQLADLLDKGVDSLVGMVRGQGQPDIIRENLAVPMVEGMAGLPSLALRDPKAAVDTISPPNLLAQGGYDIGEGVEKAVTGKSGGAEQMVQGATETVGAGLGVVGLRSGPKPAPSVKSTVRETGKGLAGVATDAPIRPQAVDAITRILENSGVPRDRIVSGLGRVVDLTKEATGRAATVAQLLQREFGEEFPQVVENIETVLRERSLTRGKRFFGQADQSPSIVRETAQDMRSTQVPFIEQSADRNLGANSRMATRDEIRADMKRIGDTAYEPLLAAPVDDARVSRIWDVLLGPDMKELYTPLRQIAAGEARNIDTMIQNEPVRAAHWMQHKARLLAESYGKDPKTEAQATAYNAMRSRLLATIDDLEVPGQPGRTYKDIRKEYGDEAGANAALNMADSFGRVARNPENMDIFLRKVEELTPDQRSAALLSVRDWVKTQLRGAPEDAPARLGVLSSHGVLQALDNLGPEGQALATDIRAVRGENRFLDPVTNRNQSATMPNAQALQEGPGIYSRGGGAGIASNVVADAALMTSGLAAGPIMTAMRQGPKLYSSLVRPRIKTLEDMTKVLMARQKEAGPALREQRGPPGGGGKPGLSVVPKEAPSGGPPKPPGGDKIAEARQRTVDQGDLEGYKSWVAKYWPNIQPKAAESMFLVEAVNANSLPKMIARLPRDAQQKIAAISDEAELAVEFRRQWPLMQPDAAREGAFQFLKAKKPAPPPKPGQGGSPAKSGPKSKFNTRTAIKDAPEELRKIYLNAPEGISQLEWTKVRNDVGPGRLPGPYTLQTRIEAIQRSNPSAADLRRLRALQAMREALLKSGFEFE